MVEGLHSWRVLTIYNDKALIISDPIVARASYNTKLMNVVWKDCSLREYLNSTFMDEFTDQERMRIVSSAVKNENNSEYGTSAGEDTIEFVFLLSSREMREYFSSDKDRIPESADAGAKWYWLRSPGGNNTFAVIVDANGSVNEGGNTVNKMDGGIRPAMWIKL